MSDAPDKKPAKPASNIELFDQRLAARHRKGKIFSSICFGSTWFGMFVLVALIVTLIVKGGHWLSGSFLTEHFVGDPFENAQAESPTLAVPVGIMAGMIGTFWLVLLTGMISIPIGVATAIYLEEYLPDRRLRRTIQLNIANLAGVPSIVYGLLGLTVFVRMFDVFDEQMQLTLFGSVAIPLPFGKSVLSGALTLSLLILPVIVVATQEALRAVPSSIRHASLALGATRWQTVRHQVLPASTPGIATGVILALSRAIGETAPLIVVGAVASVSSLPGLPREFSASPLSYLSHPEGLAGAPFDRYSALPIQVYTWTKYPEEAIKEIAAAGIIVLLCFLFLMNGLAIWIRNRTQKKLS